MMYENNQKKINKQDDLLDQIIDSADMVKGQAGEMEDTLKYQDDLIYNIDKKADNNINHMHKTNNGLDKVLESQSTCCLYIVIAVEVAVMILLFLN
jgi:hypothetical protein